MAGRRGLPAGTELEGLRVRGDGGSGGEAGTDVGGAERMKIIKDQTLSGRSRVEKDGKGFVSAGPPTKSRTWCLGKSIDLQVGVCALPHPYKMPDDVANSRRDYGPGKETCTDVSLSEDSHFMARLSWPTENSDYVTYVGVADGVGSWRGVGVDPRDYSQRIMACAQVSCLRIHRYSSTPATYHPTTTTHHPPLTTQHVLDAAQTGNSEKTTSAASDELHDKPIRPLDVLMGAWEMVQREKVVGSCTACIVTLDHELNQLQVSA